MVYLQFCEAWWVCDDIIQEKILSFIVQTVKITYLAAFHS
jgi:hypothetical protein